MSDSNTNSIDAAKWDWKAGGGKPAQKKPMDTRAKAVIQSVVMLGVAFLLHHFRHRVFLPSFLCGFAFIVLVSGLLVPSMFRAIDKFFSVTLVKWVGTGLTYLFLVPFYFIVFVPAHWILNAKHVDPMAREFPTKLATYWIPRKPVDAAQYKRQH